MYNKNCLNNIDLAYTYTENYLKDRKTEINNIKLRQGTFLGFAGVLLRFNLELLDSQPSYLITKIAALVTCFSSILILGWGLRAYFSGIVVHPSNLIEDDFLKTPNSEIKLEIIINNTTACDDIYLLAVKQRSLLNHAITLLVFSALFFTLNGVLVSFFGK